MSTVTLYSHRKLSRNRQAPMTYATDPLTGGTMIVHGRNTNLFRAPAEDGYANETKDSSRRRITKPQINAQTRTFHIYKPAYLWWRNANNAYCLTNSKLYSWQIFCDVRCTRNVPVLYCVNASTTNARFAWFCCWRVDLRKHSESRHRFLSLYISKALTARLCWQTKMLFWKMIPWEKYCKFELGEVGARVVMNEPSATKQQYFSNFRHKKIWRSSCTRYVSHDSGLNDFLLFYWHFFYHVLTIRLYAWAYN